jgi:AmpD protein
MMTDIAIENHRISGAIWAPSPHCDARPADLIDLIVIHGIALPPEIWNPLPVLAFFQGTLHHASDPYFEALDGVTVSAHVVIGRQGEMYQTVGFDQRAWHAGQSSFSGRSACNDFSIGIELIGPEEGPFTDAQYESLGSLCAALCSQYKIPSAHIVGHRDIAPGRKVDPGADFNFDRIRPA